MEDTLDSRIGQWRQYLLAHPAMTTNDISELEDHLRNSIGELRAAGLSEDEAFDVATRRLGDVSELAREYAHAHPERASQKFTPEVSIDQQLTQRAPSGLGLAILLALGAVVAVKIPQLFFLGDETPYGYLPEAYYEVMLRNAIPITLAFVAAYFLIRRKAGVIPIIATAIPFAATVLALNLYPFQDLGSTTFLAIAHSLVLLWLTLGIGYLRGRVRSPQGRMNFVRFTGGWVIYAGLMWLGWSLLSMLISGALYLAGIESGTILESWLLLPGAAAIAVMAAWLVDAAPVGVETIAPVLSWIFTPLVTAVLLVFMVVAMVAGNPVEVSRDLLTIFDVLLIVTVAVLLYSYSARDPWRKTNAFDVFQAVMLVAASILGLYIVVALIARGASGFTAIQATALGMSVILLVNLVGATIVQFRMLRGTAAFATAERWQVAFLPVYLVWAAIVVIAIPPLFQFE